MLQRQEVGVQLLHRHLEPSVNRLVFGLMVSALRGVGDVVGRGPPLVAGTSVFGVIGCTLSALLGSSFRAIQHSGRLDDEER